MKTAKTAPVTEPEDWRWLSIPGGSQYIPIPGRSGFCDRPSTPLIHSHVLCGAAKSFFWKVSRPARLLQTREFRQCGNRFVNKALFFSQICDSLIQT